MLADVKNPHYEEGWYPDPYTDPYLNPHDEEGLYRDYSESTQLSMRVHEHLDTQIVQQRPCAVIFSS